MKTVCIFVVIGFIESAFAVTNGYITAPAEFPQVVVLTDLDGRSNCTGTLVSDRVIITAAHCLDQHPILLSDEYTKVNSISDWNGLKMVSRPNEIMVYFGNGIENAVQPRLSGLLKVVGAHVYPGYFDKDKINKNDIGFVVLENSISRMNPVKIGNVPDSGDVVKMVGFGSIDYCMDNLKSGVQSAGNSQADELRGTDILVYRRKIDEPSLNKGDSGGPLLNNRGEIIGVGSSFEDNGSLEPTAVHFRLDLSRPSLSTYTAISPYRCWLNYELTGRQSRDCPAVHTFQADGETRDISLRAATALCMKTGFKLCSVTVSAPGVSKECTISTKSKYFGLANSANYHCEVYGVY